MITKCSISRYRCFKDLNIEKLAPITLIGGKNNVGKSTLLEALLIPFIRIHPYLFLQHLLGRGLSVISTDHETMWAPLFYNFDLNGIFSIQITIDKNSTETLSVDYDPNYVPEKVSTPDNQQSSNSFDIRQNYTAISTGALHIKYTVNDTAPQESTLTTGINGVHSFFHGNISFVGRPHVFLPSRLPISSADDSSRFGQLDKANKEKQIIEILQIIEPKISDLSAINIGNIPVLHIRRDGDSNKLPVNLSGDGIAKLTSLALAVANCENGVVFIDEVENGIHYSKQEAIWNAITSLAAKVNCQIIATTHSYEFLSNAHRANANTNSLSDRFLYVRLDRKDNVISPKYFSHADLDVALEANWEVR